MHPSKRAPSKNAPSKSAPSKNAPHKKQHPLIMIIMIFKEVKKYRINCVKEVTKWQNESENNEVPLPNKD